MQQRPMVVEDECHADVSHLCREFQWLSRLPITGELDRATLRQMAEPRCGVSDEGSQQLWAQRVNAIFTAGRDHGGQPRRHKKRSASQGEFVYLVCIHEAVQGELVWGPCGFQGMALQKMQGIKLLRSCVFVYC